MTWRLLSVVASVILCVIAGYGPANKQSHARPIGRHKEWIASTGDRNGSSISRTGQGGGVTSVMLRGRWY